MEKNIWYEVVGMDADRAKRHILGENKNLMVYVHQIDEMVTADWKSNRVRIFLGKDGKVAYPPQIG